MRLEAPIRHHARTKGQAELPRSFIQFLRHVRLQCWCGDDNYDLYGQSNRCTMACAGDSDELCGGSYAMSVYENEKPVPPGYVGCFTDKSPGRIMTDQRRSGDMTAEAR